MKHLIIIGAGGFGREIYCTATESLGYGDDFDIKGFLDPDFHKLDGFANYPPILGVEEDYNIEADDVFICAFGDVKLKKKCCEKILAKGGEFITLIHKSAYVGQNTVIGKGSILLALSRVHCDVTIGNFVTVQPYAVVGHDVIIGDWCHINDYADCGGATRIEDEVTIHTHSFVLPGFTVGRGATIGAGSIVINNVKEGVVMFGNPARPLPLPRKE